MKCHIILFALKGDNQSGKNNFNHLVILSTVRTKVRFKNLADKIFEEIADCRYIVFYFSSNYSRFSLVEGGCSYYVWDYVYNNTIKRKFIHLSNLKNICF